MFEEWWSANSRLINEWYEEAILHRKLFYAAFELGQADAQECVEQCKRIEGLFDAHYVTKESQGGCLLKLFGRATELISTINKLETENSELRRAQLPHNLVNEVRRQTIADCVKAIESLPARIETISGQNFTYVQRGEAIDAMRHLEI